MLKNNLKALVIQCGIACLVLFMEFYMGLGAFGLSIVLIIVCAIYVLLGFLFMNPHIKFGLLSTSSTTVLLLVMRYVSMASTDENVFYFISSFFNHLAVILGVLLSRFNVFSSFNEWMSIYYFLGLITASIPSLLLYLGIIIRRGYKKNSIMK